MSKHKVTVEAQGFNFGEIKPQLYDPAKGWFTPDREKASAMEQRALAELANPKLERTITQ